MITLSSTTSSGFTWSKMPRSGGYEVKLQGAIVGTLRRTSLWSSNHQATTLNGTFTFRKCCWGTKAEMVDSASRQQIAIFQSGWRKRSTLTFADGQRFYFERKGCWRHQWSVYNQSGQPVLSLDIREKSADAEIGNEMERNRLALLIMFILYRIRQSEEEAASAIAATVALIASS